MTVLIALMYISPDIMKLIITTSMIAFVIIVYTMTFASGAEFRNNGSSTVK